MPADLHEHLPVEPAGEDEDAGRRDERDAAAASTPPGVSASPPPGMRIMDVAPQVTGVAWSPDGGAFGVAAWNPDPGTGRVDLFAPTGRRLSSTPGWAFGWIDATHVLIYAPANNVAGPGDVTLRALDGGLVERLPGAFGGVLGNDHGSAELDMAPPMGAYSGGSYYIWWRGTLGPLVQGFDHPWAWSPDGHLLAFWWAAMTAATPQSGIVLASTMPAVTLTVRRYPGGAEVKLPSGIGIDYGRSVRFSPGSRYLAAAETSSDDPLRDVGTVVFDLASGTAQRVVGGGIPGGWTPDGRLVVERAGASARLWSPSGTLSDSGLPPGWAAYGPSMSDVAVVGTAAGTPRFWISTARGSRQFALQGGDPFALYAAPTSVTWAPDGASCWIATPGELLRVAAP